MSTRLMLIRDSIPLSGRRVRVKGIEGEFTSDSDGMVDVPIESNTFSIAVRDTDDWIVKRITRTKTEASMIVVNVGEKSPGRSRWELTSRYEFDRVLGRGGMGVVVRAEDTVLHRPVAIKMLSEEFLDNHEAQELFMTEGRAMATLSHPNLVTVHDVTEADGRVMMVLEFVAGQNVEELLGSQGKLASAEALSITIQVMRALEYLHNQGVIHRDLKPGNFMVDGAGTVKVIDFGLARSLDDLYDKGTRVRGTPAYMAPEQILGNQMSAATDLYQMAVSLWELLVGALPFSGELLYAHVHEDVPRIRSVDPAIDPEIDDLLWRCLQKDPNQRPQSTAAVRAELESIYYRLATDPNLGTAETAHMIEADLSKKGRQTNPLTPPVQRPSSSEPGVESTAQNAQGTAPRADDATDDDAPAERGRRILPIIALVSLIALAGIGAVVSGAFAPDDQVEEPTAPTEAVAEAPRANDTPPAEDAPAEVVVVDEKPQTAFIIARRTVRSSVAASRTGTAVADELRKERAERASERAAKAKRPSPARRADKPDPPEEAQSAEPTATATGQADEPAPEPTVAPSAADPAPNQPALFQPKPLELRRSQKKKTEPKKEKEPAPKEADPKVDDESDEPQNKVPVSF